VTGPWKALRDDGKARVCQGSLWTSSSFGGRSVYRNSLHSRRRRYNIGLRLARDPVHELGALKEEPPSRKSAEMGASTSKSP